MYKFLFQVQQYHRLQDHSQGQGQHLVLLQYHCLHSLLSATRWLQRHWHYTSSRHQPCPAVSVFLPPWSPPPPLPSNPCFQSNQCQCLVPQAQSMKTLLQTMKAMSVMYVTKDLLMLCYILVDTCVCVLNVHKR